MKLKLEGKYFQKKKWERQRAKYGFSIYDTFEINNWFLKTIPNMLEVLIKNSQAIPKFIIDEYCKCHNGFVGKWRSKM